ncbi:hypothetical protein [Streptomyces sp. NPDC101455]|uniref:hypothetical protein n=1 Tax=Streptomyces sp. NPDC101455 TaxID=3366142 RepID=UPI00381C70F2
MARRPRPCPRPAAPGRHPRRHGRRGLAAQPCHRPLRTTHRSIHHLREDLLRGHLAQQWGTDPGDHHALTTAAFDRALPSLDASLEAARPFCLHTCGARRLLDRERQPSAA